MAAKQATKERTVIEQVRDLMPRRALLLTEAYSIAEHQATTLLDLLDIRFPHVTYDKLLSLPNVEVHLEPDYRMQHFSGLSRFSHGRWLILIDKNDVHGRRRFTLAHEFKHVIDHSLDTLAYGRLGYGDEHIRHAHIEAICQHFAACFLMPKTWVKNSWANGMQDVYDLSSLFQVSVTAMEVRLRAMGLLDDAPQRDIHTYFRHSTPLFPIEYDVRMWVRGQGMSCALSFGPQSRARRAAAVPLSSKRSAAQCARWEEL